MTTEVVQRSRRGPICTLTLDSPHNCKRALDEWVERAVGSILLSAPGAVSATKRLLAEMPWAEGLVAAHTRSAELFAGAEAEEGVAAFLHKRTPPWAVTAP